MNFMLLAVVVIVECLIITDVLGQVKDPKVGQIVPSIQAQAGGKNLKNFQGNYNVGLRSKVWESIKRDKSFELGVNYGRGILRHQGQTFQSKPVYGVGGTFRFGRK